MSKLKSGREIHKFTRGSTAYKSWTDGFNRLGTDLTNSQRIQLLRVKVQGTAERTLDGVVAVNAYNADQDDATRISLIRGALDGTYDTPEIREGLKDSLKNCVHGPKELIEDCLHRWEEAYSRTTLDYDEGPKIYEFKRGVDKQFSAKVETLQFIGRIG